MATDLGRVKSTSASKYDALVASQLAQAETRIRMLDLTAGLLGFAALSLAYVVGMVVCDSKLLFSPSARQMSLFVFLGGAAVYLYWAVIRPLRMRVNPYYAARQVEQQLPHAKNSIVNWVDLHEQTLPPAIRGALSQRAAKDLSRVDLDRAFSSRRAAWTGGLAALFAVAFIASFFLLGPRPFLSLLQRTFNPFAAAAGVSTRTQLKLLKPEGGNTTVTVGRGVNFVVDVSGKVPSPKGPDAVKLLYRYEESEPWLERLLFQEPSGDWTTSLSALEVRNGFWYKITGGDDQTEEYYVGVRAAPAITDFLAMYHFRPYVVRVDEVHRERELKALRGTEVLLRVRTNRALRAGRLEFEGNERADGVKPPLAAVPGVVDPNDPHTFWVRFILEEDGKYRLGFTSTDSEAYSDPTAYTVTAIPDKPPTVELTKPGRDIRLPADALLHLEGKAGDDIGVKSLLLQMRVVGRDRLRGQPYRSDEQLRLADGGYPRELEYKDFVELSRVKSENGQPYALRAGMELEYWLEASDACDYPRANVAESKHYRVLLTEPEKDPKKQQQEKQQSEKDKKQHEQKQDQKLQQENQDRQQQRQEQQARNKEEQNKGQNGSEGNKSEENKGQNGSEGKEGAAGGNKSDNQQQGDSKGGSGEQKSAEQKDGGQSQEEQKIEERINKALEKQQAGKDSAGESKPDKGDQGEGKGAQTNKSDGGDKTQGGSKEAGEGKDKGQPQAGNDPSQGDGKGENAPRPKSGDKSEPKSGAPGKQEGKPGADNGKPESASHSSGDKSSSDPQASKSDGPNKPKPKDQGHDPTKSDSKPAQDNAQTQGDRGSTTENKDKGNSSETKGSGERKDNGNAEKKQGKAAPKGDRSGQSEPKPSDPQSEKEQPTNNETQPSADTPPRNATAKEVQDLARKLGSKDARERGQAKQQLERIEKDATDPQAREKADAALKKMGEPDRRDDKGTPKKDNGSSGKKEQDKEGNKNDGSPGADSSGDKKSDKAKGQEAGQKNGEGEKNGKGSPSREASEGTQQSPGGNTPAGGNRRSGGGRSDTQEKDQQRKPQKPRDHRAAELQLEDFAKRVNKDILKEAGISEEAWKRYLESKRKQLAPREKTRPEGPSIPQQANQLPSMGGKTIQPSESGQGNDPAANRGQAPPGYRDAKRKFTRQMSEKD